jgi:hypothetical protein
MKSSEQVPVWLDFPTDAEMLDEPNDFQRICTRGKTVRLETCNHIKAVVECDSVESARKLAAQIKTNAASWMVLGKAGVVRMRCNFIMGGDVRGVGLSPRETAALARTHEKVNADTWRKRPPSSEGVFYVIRNSDGWGVYAYRFDQYPKIGHPEFWESVVAPVLARRWAHNDPPRFRKLEADLVNHPYGFPHGRVTKTGRQYTVYHGNDLRGLIARKAIEEAFGVGKRCRWEFDPHERCLRADKDSVCHCLGIRE